MSSTELALISSSPRVVLCARQDQIEITFDDQRNVEISQTNWPDENQVVRISRDNVQTFLDAICDALGVASVRP